jgi:DNA-3-methyladenine glycosylase II
MSLTEREQIKLHFRKRDPVIHKVIRRLDLSTWLKPRKPKQYFLSLCQDIISQQLSDKAAMTIGNRFEALFPKKNIAPQHVLAVKDETLRQVGMSWSKASYVKNIAQAFLAGELKAAELQKLPDEEVITKLVKIKGIGRWTAEMFLIFSLGREDVFSHGDLGLRRAIEKLYRLTNPTQQQVETIIQTWSPYRSYGCLALWRSLED